MSRVAIVAATVAALLPAGGLRAAEPPAADLQTFGTDSVTRLRLEIRSGDIDIRGVPGKTVTVRDRDGGTALPPGMDVSWRVDKGVADLKVEGGPRQNFGLVIEVPQQIDLEVRLPAGDLDVSGVTGSKDVTVRAGDVTIEMGDPASYREVHAFVLTGQLQAPRMNIDKAGLWRSVTRTGTGKYELRASLLAGDLLLK
jgi:hypothetical protein